MATQAEIKQRYAEWQEHCRHVQSITDTALLARETPVEKDRRIRRLQKDYASFCEYYFPHFLQLRDKVTGEVVRTIHNAPFHNTAAAKVKSTPNLKAVFKWPRGHAKSTHFDIFMPLWLMFQPKRLINFMVVVGKSEDSAIRLLSDIQAELSSTSDLSPISESRKASATGRKGSSRHSPESSSWPADAANRPAVSVSVRHARTTSSSTTSTTTSFAATRSASKT